MKPKMEEENKENPTVKNNPVINDLLMKPFTLGWTREVVKRLVTNSKTPDCDIYYLSPDKKRLRSLTEVKGILTDGLSPECFSFKRKPLGLSPDLETIRDAKARGKGAEKSKEKKKTSSVTRKQIKSENSEAKDEDNENKTKKKKTETETETKDLKPDSELEEKKEKLDANNSGENSEVKNEAKKKSETKSEIKPETKPEMKPEMKPRRAKSNVKKADETKTFNNKKKTKTKTKPVKPVKSVKKRKAVLKKVMNAKKAKQAKLLASRKVLKKIVRKKVASLKHKLSKTKANKKAAKKPLKNSLKKEAAKEPETNETDKNSAPRDLKSIVKKNIVKYREMREKQKLGVVKAQRRSSVKKIPVAKVSRSRLEPISKNRHVYIKPLEKGWRRELVFRKKCTNAGQRADVYYFHPSGKKLRSFREVSENLTHGLSIECFTFRKEAIGYGEPSEIIRNARDTQKN